MTRLELANQLIENQPAFHFAFIPVIPGARGEIRTHHKANLKSAASSNWATRANGLNWYRRRDSNPHCLVPKTSASSRLGYAGMVNPAGLEPATCRLGNDCSDSI